ncbi:MAG: hypothetical protein ACK5MF_04150 [Vibrio sp.]|uniref:hypothetical protein n=1 Tax=Vibrio sp. TaxID=678 RepID=UPI003A86736F
MLMRDATNSVTLRADTYEPVEIRKNDVIPTQGFTMLELSNHHGGAVTVEYQITDLAINAQSDAVSVSGAVTVDEIKKPVVVSGVQDVVAARVVNDISVANFPDVQKVEVLNQPDFALEMPEQINVREERSTLNNLGHFFSNGQMNIPENPNRKAVIVFAPASNPIDITVGELIPISPGGHAVIPVTNELRLDGGDTCTAYVGEFV